MTSGPRRIAPGASRRRTGRLRADRCAAVSPSRATSRSRCRGPASATASTARSRRTRRTSTRPTRSSEQLDEALRRSAKELLVLTGERPEVNPRSPRACAESGHEDFTSYVVWACERALERGLLPHTNLGVPEPRGPRAAARGDRLAGPDARVDHRAADGDRPRRLADQAPGAAAGDDPRRRRAADPVHERDPGRHRRDRGRAGRVARGARRGARASTATSRR